MQTGGTAGSVRPWMDARLPGWLAILRRWVGQNSYTWNASGVDRLGEMTAEAFAPFGFAATTQPAVTAGMGRHLLLSRPGTGPAAVSLVTHLDTVYPEEEEGPARRGPTRRSHR